MDIIRGRLIAKIDEIVSQIASSDTTPSHSLLQIEASLVSNTISEPSSTRIVLDTISVDDLRYHISESRSSSPWNTPISTSFHNGLPSPKDSNYADTPPRTGVHVFNVSHHPLSTAGASYDSVFRGHIPAPELQPYNHNVQNSSRLIEMSAFSNTQTSQQDSQQHPSPKRRKLSNDSNTPEQPVVDKLIEGIWEQIHKPRSLAMGTDLVEAMSVMLERMTGNGKTFSASNLDFGKATQYCRQITTGSRTTRAFEVIVQAHWVDCYDARLVAVREANPHLRPSECKKMVINEACTSFAWSEKDLRNRT